VLRALSLVVMLLALGIPTAQAGKPEVIGRAPALFSPRTGNGCQTQSLCAAIERLGLYASLHLNTATPTTEASPQTALGGTLGVGLDLIRHIAVEASIPAAVVYQGTAPALLVGGPLQVGTRLVFGAASPTLFSERTPPRWALILASYAQLRLPHAQGDERAAPVEQTGVAQGSAHAAVELTWGPVSFTPELSGVFAQHAADLQVGGRLSLRLSPALVVDLEGQSRIPLYVADSQASCGSSTRAGLGVRGVLGTGILGLAHYSLGSGTCSAGHQLTLGVAFAFGEEPLRRPPTGETLGLERLWLGMVDPVLDCNGWMLSDDTLLPLFKFGEPDPNNPTVIRRGEDTFQVGDHFDIDRYGRLYRPHQLVALAGEHEFKEAPAQEKARLPVCSFGPQHHYQKQCGLRQKALDYLQRQELSEGGAGLLGSAVMKLQLDRQCVSKQDLDDPRQLAADIVGLLGAMKGVRPAGRQAAEPPKPSQSPRSTFLHENEARGGHVLDKHVGKTDEELLQRLKRESHLTSASTFTDEASAEQVIKAALAENQVVINQWLSQTDKAKLRLDYESVGTIGRILSSGQRATADSKNAVLILQKAKEGYFVLTAYVR
jgi:hypothetical protein